MWKSLDLDFLPFVIFLLRMRLSNITSQVKIPPNLFQNIPEEFSLFNIWHFIEFDHKQFKTFKKRRNLKSEAWHATPLGTLHILPNNTWNHYSYLKYVKMFFNSKHENLKFWKCGKDKCESLEKKLWNLIDLMLPLFIRTICRDTERKCNKFFSVKNTN